MHHNNNPLRVTSTQLSGSQPHQFRNWTALAFGKFRDKTLPQVLFADPDWFFWAMEEGVLRGYPSLLFQGKELQKKATRIKVPQKGTEPLVVEHFIIANRRYSHFNLAPEGAPLHQGSSRGHRESVIDLSFPRRLCRYDKTGNKNIVASLKQVYFGNQSTRMTRENCEAFYNCCDNFEPS